MRISLNTLSMNNSQPLRFGKRNDSKAPVSKASVSSKAVQNDKFDYKAAYEQSQMELGHTRKKYDVLCNLCALGLNPNFK